MHYCEIRANSPVHSWADEITGAANARRSEWSGNPPHGGPSADYAPRAGSQAPALDMCVRLAARSCYANASAAPDSGSKRAGVNSAARTILDCCPTRGDNSATVRPRGRRSERPGRSASPRCTAGIAERADRRVPRPEAAVTLRVLTLGVRSFL